MISFTVPGRPATKGSFRPVRTREGKTRLVPQLKRSAPWQEAIGWAAKAAMRGAAPMTRPVEVGAMFVFARPRKTILAAPAPDLDKLLRALFDALTSIVYGDDKQVERVDAGKRWALDGEVEGVEIVVRERSATPILDMARAVVAGDPNVLAILAGKTRRSR